MAKRKDSTKAARKVGDSDVRAYVKVFHKLMAEKNPAVPKDFAEAVESSVTGSGLDAVNRRIAIAFLSRPFKVIAETIRKDSSAAEALAASVLSIEHSAKKYKELGDLMETAAMRIHLALCQREDMQEITTSAKASTAG